MNLTLSLDEKTVKKARAAANALGKSLNQLLREYLEQLGDRASAAADIAELRKLSLASGGNSGGRKVNRDELHERR